MPNPEPVPEELRSAFSQRDLVICVGPHMGGGEPDEQQLADRLAEFAAAEDPSLELDDLRARIEVGRTPEVFQLLHRAMGDRFIRKVQDLLTPPRGELPPPLASLARLRPRLRALYTVRMDRRLEQALEGRWPSFHAPRADLVQRRNIIFKIFGALDDPGSWVLTQAQVQRELGTDAERHEMFAAAYRAHQMLFVGFEPGDPELERLLEMTPASGEGEGPGHYIVLRECSRADRTLLEGRGLQLVESELVAVFDTLAETLGGQTFIEVPRPPAPGPEPEPKAVAPPPAPAPPWPRWVAGGAVLAGLAVAVMMATGDGPTTPKVSNAASMAAPSLKSNAEVSPAAAASSTPHAATTGANEVEASGATEASASTGEVLGTTTTPAETDDEATDSGRAEPAPAPGPGAKKSPAKKRVCFYPVGDTSRRLTKTQAKAMRCDPAPTAARKRGCDVIEFCR